MFSLAFKPIDHYFGCNWTGKLAGNYTFMLNTKIGVINQRWFQWAVGGLHSTGSLNVTFSNVRVPLLSPGHTCISQLSPQITPGKFSEIILGKNCILENKFSYSTTFFMQFFCLSFSGK